jgi:hypothetical protein
MVFDDKHNLKKTKISFFQKTNFLSLPGLFESSNKIDASVAAIIESSF